MNVAILAAMMAAQRTHSSSRRHRAAPIHLNGNHNVAEQLLLQKGDPVTMKIAYDDKFVCAEVLSIYGGTKWACTINGQELTAPTVEECIEKVVTTTQPKEIQLLTHSLADGCVNSYLLLLRTHI